MYPMITDYSEMKDYTNISSYDKYACLKLYQTYVRLTCILEYASPAWSPHLMERKY